ncbi:ABC transporter substrate-binding protein [Paenibacillus sp. OAS669]|uniref:ABC transporter substrate-binding protein n=1 Tax=Paenibacillus sp. OAS669 TaxID=2663821 RepID=UPI00178ADE40|nr:extracellular solute-binding protein [Paenibacillus sp. OAS669]MBE1442990.1 multiple sugar transport system substrate-binding protein [Paenibacillus sp. OAS669]
MKRYRIVFMSICVLAAAGLSACSKGQPSASQTNDASPPGGERTELFFYSGGGDTTEAFDARFGDALRKKFPNYDITYIPVDTNNRLQQLVTAGKRIDFYYGSIGVFPEFTQIGLQFDMTDLAKKHNVDLSSFEPTLIDAAKMISDGKLYGLPVFNNIMVTYYNKTLFQKFGIPSPKDGMTWDEMHDLARKMTRNDGGKQYIGLVVSPTHVLRLNQFSQPYVDPKTEQATINSDMWKRMYEAYYTIPAQDQGYKDRIVALNNKLPYKDDFLKDQNLAMFVYLSDLQSILSKEMAALDWDIVSMPTFKELPGIGSQAYPTFMSITNQTVNKDAAMEVLKYLVSEEYQTLAAKKAALPVLKSKTVQDALGQSAEFKDKNLKAIFFNQLAPISPKSKYDGAVEKAYTKPQVDLSLGKIDLNTALRSAEEEANKAIEQEKRK